ncbi:MAG: hypothetical protein PHW22_03040 [Bacilli bacterium]|nr:hypothetical protein [Bacilli bacterium]
MKKTILLPLLMVGLLSLTGCGEGYGDFALVEDSQDAQSTFEDVKTKNTQIDTMSGFEVAADINGSVTTDTSEELAIATKATTRIGSEDTRFVSDTIIESDYGSLSTYIRYDAEKNAYFDYIKLDFSYDNAGTTISSKKNMLVEDDSYDPSVNYDDSKIATIILNQYGDSLHALASLDYSEDVNVYTSSNGYYKFETTEQGNLQTIIFDENGYPVELDINQDKIAIVEKLNYDVKFDNVATDEYEKRDLNYQMEFATAMMSFISLSLGGLLDIA